MTEERVEVPVSLRKQRAVVERLSATRAADGTPDQVDVEILVLFGHRQRRRGHPHLCPAQQLGRRPVGGQVEAQDWTQLDAPALHDHGVAVAHPHARPGLERDRPAVPVEVDAAVQAVRSADPSDHDLLRPPGRATGRSRHAHGRRCGPPRP